MGRKNKGFSVPKEMRKEYYNLVQRANRQMKYIQRYVKKHNITNEHSLRSLMSGYHDTDRWHTEKTPFSRSVQGRYIIDADTGDKRFKEFSNITEVKQYMRHLEKWGYEREEKGEAFVRAHQNDIKAGYKEKIIKALNEVVDQYSISLPNNQLPKEIMDELDSLSFSQISNFFEGGHPGEDMMVAEFDTHTQFKAVDSKEDFIDVVMTRLGQLKRFR